MEGDFQICISVSLIVGDSIINGVLEGLCRGGCNVKVRNFLGVTVDDLNEHIIPLLQKNSTHSSCCNK